MKRLLLPMLLLAGCCAKSPIGQKINRTFVNLEVVREVDPQGNLIKNTADCRKGVVIGWDAKTRTQIVDCGWREKK